MGARREEVGEMFSESVTQRERERERSLIHINKQAVDGTHKKRGGKKMVTFLRHLKTCWLF